MSFRGIGNSRQAADLEDSNSTGVHLFVKGGFRNAVVFTKLLYSFRAHRTDLRRVASDRVKQRSIIIRVFSNWFSQRRWGSCLRFSRTSLGSLNIP